jgi:transposase-like protein
LSRHVAETKLHLGYLSDTVKSDGLTDERNGASGKTLITGYGPLWLDLPRDRGGCFEPALLSNTNAVLLALTSGSLRCAHAA